MAQAGKNPWTRVCVGTAIAVMLLAAPPLAAAPWPYRVSLAFWAAAAVEAPRAARERRLFPVFLFIGFSLLAVPMIRNLSLVPPAAAIVLVPAWMQTVGVWVRSRSAKRLAIAGVALSAIVVTWARLADRPPPGRIALQGRDRLGTCQRSISRSSSSETVER